MGIISKNMRITILVSSTAFFLFAFMYLILTDLYLTMMEWPYDDPYYPRAFGINLLILGTFLLISYFRNEWLQAKILIEIVIIWAFLTLIANLIEINILTLPIGVIVATWNNTIILIVLVIVLLYFYLEEIKR